MVSSPAEESSVRVQRRTLALWLGLLGALVAAFAGTVLILNATLFSASGFAGSYLSALQRHDVDGALATPGVVGLGKFGTELLDPAALGELDAIRLVSDRDEGNGRHRLSYELELGGTKARTTFEVQYTGVRLGLFSTWSFAKSPLSVLRVTPLHDASFTVNGVTITSGGGPNASSDHQVLTPGLYTVAHRSPYLTADPVPVAATAGETVIPTTVDIRANDDFVSLIQKQVDDFLDECTTQEVLFPTGCPFGQELANRVESTPVWSMTDYPSISIEPGAEPGTWVVPETAGAAHLTVEVRSLFDGSLSTFDEDVAFSVHWVMRLDGSRVDIQAS